MYNKILVSKIWVFCSSSINIHDLLHKTLIPGFFVTDYKRIPPVPLDEHNTPNFGNQILV